MAVFGPSGPKSLQWHQLSVARARSVARIERPTGECYGTGFLIRADSLFTSMPESSELLLVTCSHVMGMLDDEALRPENCIVRFEMLDPPSVFHVREVLFESPVEKLDVTVACLDATVIGADPYPLAPGEEPTFDPHLRRKLNVIGHSEGGGPSISTEDNIQVGWRNPYLHYLTPTSRGSAGGPVFDDMWRLIAVHHAGSSMMHRLDGNPGTYRANEGIWIHAIVRAIVEAAIRPPVVRPQPRSGIFISYAREDETWLKRVRRHLDALSIGTSLEIWDDTRILAGSNWLNEIRDALEHARVAVLLVSTDFLASQFIRREELVPILKANNARGLTVFPIAVSSANVQWVPELSSLQFANNPARPLDKLTKPQREAELVRIAERIASVLASRGS